MKITNDLFQLIFKRMKQKPQYMRLFILNRVDFIDKKFNMGNVGLRRLYAFQEK